MRLFAFFCIGAMFCLVDFTGTSGAWAQDHAAAAAPKRSPTPAATRAAAQSAGANFLIDNATNNLGIGYQSLANDSACCNTAVGYGTLVSNTAANNSAFGADSLLSNTTGSANTALGNYAAFSNTTGGSNTAVGTYASFCDTLGNGNVAVGTDALNGGTVGGACQITSQNVSYNTAVGNGAQYNDTSGSENTGVGQGALYNITTGSYDTALGFNAGEYVNGAGPNVTSLDSTYIGANSQANASGDTNEIVIGYATVGNGSNTTTIGNGSTTDTYIAGKLHVNGALQATVLTGAAAPSGSCTVGELYMNTAATSVSTVLYVCYPANTWTAITVP